MKTLVLDSWPNMEWITGKRGLSQDVSSLLLEAETGLWATLPVAIEVPSREDIWKAAVLKARYAISYADAFAAALAQKHDCPLVTGDPEFRSIKGLDLYWFDR